MNERIDHHAPRPCPRAPADVEDLLDGLLDADTEARLLAHLESCTICRESRREEERLRCLLGADLDVRAPAGFADEVMARIRIAPAPRTPRRSLRLVLPLLAVAAALLVLALLTGVRDRSGNRGDPRPPDRVDRNARPSDAGGNGDAIQARARDLARRARLFLAIADQASAATLRAELEVSGLLEASFGIDLASLAPADRDAVRRVVLLGESWRNGGPVAGAEIAFLTGGVR